MRTEKELRTYQSRILDIFFKFMQPYYVPLIEQFYVCLVWAFLYFQFTHALYDSYVERLLDRISNGTLADDRRNAMAELQSVVAESNAAQLAFGAMG